MEKLYLIDGMSLVFRAYHALIRTGLTNPAGEPSGALFGFTNLITTFLEKENPKNIAVVFDCREPTFRHDIYPEYKANRAEFPEELVPQLPKIKQLLDYIGIPRLEKPGFEADDIIGTLAKKASEEGSEVYCLTNDKDYYQLVDDRIKIMKPERKGQGFEYVSYEGVKRKFGVLPEQVIDVMALWGDSSDNIPGVKGVGEKTAIPLIAEFGNLEALYENLDRIERKAVRSKLEKFKDEAFLSRKLVTIVTDVDCDKKPSELIPGETDFLALDDFLKAEGMNSQRKKWFEKGKHVLIDRKDEPKEEKLDTIKNIEKEYTLVNTEEKLDNFLKYISEKEEIAFDLETSSLDTYTCDIVGIAFAAEPDKAFYIAVTTPEKESSGGLFEEKKEDFIAIDCQTAIKKLKPLLEDKNIGKFGQNIKFDASILRRYGVRVEPLTYDTMIASFLLDSNSGHGLDALSEKYLDYKPISISSLIGEKKKEQRSMADINPEEISDYACEDADLAWQLRQKIEPLMEKSGLDKLAARLEFPLINILIDMEQEGVSINQKAFLELENKIGGRVKELTKEIHDEAGAEFNIDSTKQLRHILFEKMMIPPVKKTKTGYSTDVNVLTKLAETYPIAELLLEYRSLQKLLNTYVETLPKLVKPHSGKIHTTFNQHIAGTGRLSSTNPNLQNIPIRTELGKEIRKVFVPSSSDRIIMAADYSQVELRIMAYICEDETMVESFKKGLDIHSATAANLFEKSTEEVTKDERRAAKTVNFGIMYGLGAYGLSQRLDIPQKRAKEIIDNYFDKFPFIKTYMDKTIEFTKKHGYAETLCGRRRYFPDINAKNRQAAAAAERAAINMPIQGSAADMMKIAMIDIGNTLRKEKYESKMILQVHDELVFDAVRSELEDLKAMAVEKMVGAISLGDVPVVVDCGIGENWFEAH